MKAKLFIVFAVAIVMVVSVGISGAQKGAEAIPIDPNGARVVAPA